MYVLSNVVKTYPRFELIIDELAVHRGEILGVLGPSGAGKTTLLRLLGFLELADDGCIEFMGRKYHQDIPALPIQRRLTTVFQRPALLKTSVWNNIVYPLRVRKQRIVQREVEEIADKLGISDILQQSCATLSGGEAQRVALARALIFKPDVLLLDEPTANLDPVIISVIESMVVDYLKRYGPAIVWITHNQFQARRVSDRCCLIEQGQVVEAGLSEQFFNNPGCQRTQEFLRGDVVY